LASAIIDRWATRITTNLGFEHRDEVPRSRPLVDALRDNLQPHCITLPLARLSLDAFEAPTEGPVPLCSVPDSEPPPVAVRLLGEPDHD